MKIFLSLCILLIYSFFAHAKDIIVNQENILSCNNKIESYSKSHNILINDNKIFLMAERNSMSFFPESKEEVQKTGSRVFNLWRCPKCGYYNNRNQSFCDNCFYYSEDVDQDFKVYHL